MLCQVRVLFGKLAFGFDLPQKEQKVELLWFSAPGEPPLLAAVRWPQLVPSVRACGSVGIHLCNCLPLTVNLTVCVTQRPSLPQKVPSCKNFSGVLAISPALRTLSLAPHHFVSSRRIYLQFYRSEKSGTMELFSTSELTSLKEESGGERRT